MPAAKNRRESAPSPGLRCIGLRGSDVWVACCLSGRPLPAEKWLRFSWCFPFTTSKKGEPQTKKENSQYDAKGVLPSHARRFLAGPKSKESNESNQSCLEVVYVTIKTSPQKLGISVTGSCLDQIQPGPQVVHSSMDTLWGKPKSFVKTKQEIQPFSSGSNTFKCISEFVGGYPFGGMEK